MPLNNGDISDHIISLVLGIIFLGQAWVNLINNKVSTFSIDALIIFLAQKLGTKNIQKRFLSFPRNRIEMVLLGLFALLAGLKEMQYVAQLIR